MSSVRFVTTLDQSLTAGARFRQQRWIVGMSREYLASVTNVSVEQITQFEDGKRYLGRAKLIRLALAIGVAPRVLANVVPSAGLCHLPAIQGLQREVYASNVIPLRR